MYWTIFLNPQIVDAKKIAIDNSIATTKLASKASRRDGLLSLSAAWMIWNALKNNAMIKIIDIVVFMFSDL